MHNYELNNLRKLWPKLAPQQFEISSSYIVLFCECALEHKVC